MLDLSDIGGAAILRDLSQEELSQLGSVAREDAVQKGDRLFTRGDAAERLWIVRSGRFALTILLKTLGEDAEVAVEEKREFEAFGWSAMVPPYRSIYSAYCMEDGVLVSFAREDLQRLMEADERLGHCISANLAELVAERVRVLQGLWIEEVEQRIDRVTHWTGTELSLRWAAAVHGSSEQGAARRWLASHSLWRGEP